MEAGIAWLILGIVHFRCDDYGMAQHCFLKAINRNVTSAWLGLAHLYSSLGDDDLASRAIEIVKISDENAPAWFYEAFQARNTARVGSLLGQAIDASSIVDDSLCMLWVAKGEHDGTAEDRCKIRMSLMRRLAFCPTDAVAKEALCKLEPVKKPHDSSILALVNSNDNSISTVQPADVPGDTCDSLWLQSYIFYQRDDLATAMSTQFGGSLFTPGKWADILFWHGQTQCGIEHFKLRITPELAERLPGEAGAILNVWTDIPEEVQKPLLRTKKFLTDFEQR
jgi:tetratricopeptide (TPR) repeat protein